MVIRYRDGTPDVLKAPLKKSIYSLYQLFTILKTANYRYLEFISSFDDHSSGRKKLDDVNRSQKEKDRSYRGFNFVDSRDLSALCWKLLVEENIWLTRCRGKISVSIFRESHRPQWQGSLRSWEFWIEQTQVPIMLTLQFFHTKIRKAA